MYYHTFFFFIDLVVCTVGILEFSLLPVLDASEDPLSDDAENSSVELMNTADTSFASKRASNRRPHTRTDNGTHSAVIFLDHVALNTGVATGSTSSSSSTNSATNLLFTNHHKYIQDNSIKSSSSSINSNSSSDNSSGSSYNNKNINELSVEEFRKQMAKYSSYE